MAKFNELPFIARLGVMIVAGAGIFAAAWYGFMPGMNGLAAMRAANDAAMEKVKAQEADNAKLKPYEGGESFGHDRTPDTPSRWSKNKKDDAPSWVPLKPELVCEVRYDYLQGPRFRHASTFLRWRTDKAPRDCLFSQLLPPNPFSLDAIIRLSGKP